MTQKKTTEKKEGGTKSPAVQEAEERWATETAPKPPPEPEPEEIKAKKIVKGSTVETMIIVCQCGKTGFEVKKKTSTAVALTCAACGHEMSVKGPVAITHVGEDEVLVAVRESIIRPDPDYKASTKKAPTPEQEEAKKKYTMLRFRTLIEAKEKVIDKALEAVRLMNAGDDEYKQQTWQGHALEYVCADFLSGVDPEILAHIEQIEEHIETLIKSENEKGTMPATLTRKVRDARQKERERAAAELGIIKPAKQDTKSKKKKKKNEPVKDDDERLNDNGRLDKCVKAALIDMAETYRTESGQTLGMLIGVSMAEAQKRADKDGGFIVEARGDERTRDKVGGRPTIRFWFEKEIPAMAELEIEIDYQEEYEIDLPTAEMEIVEIVPANEPAEWEMPAFCTGREEK